MGTRYGTVQLRSVSQAERKKLYGYSFKSTVHSHDNGNVEKAYWYRTKQNQVSCLVEMGFQRPMGPESNRFHLQLLRTPPPQKVLFYTNRRGGTFY